MSVLLTGNESSLVLDGCQEGMPATLKAKDYDQWLDAKEKDTDELQKLLKPYPATPMISYEVSKAVNTPSNNSPDLIENSK